MKSIIFILTIFSSLSFMDNTFAQKVKKDEQKKLALNNSQDSLEYALGIYIGKWLDMNEFKINNQDLFDYAIRNVFDKKALLMEDSIVTKMISSNQFLNQINKNQQQEEQLFTSLKGKPGVGALPDGVHYIVVKAGTGIRPSLNDTVVINAIGMFPDGSLFEDTYQKNQPITSAVSNLIPGLNEAVQIMPEGSVWRIFVPSQLGYGVAGLPNLIPPDMALVFEISLVEVRQINIIR